MALATIDETRLHLPDYPTVLEDVKARFRGIYGDDLYLGPDSQDGQLCAVFALALHDAYTLAGSVYNAYSPATAQGPAVPHGQDQRPPAQALGAAAPSTCALWGRPGRSSGAAWPGTPPENAGWSPTRWSSRKAARSP